MINKIKGFFRPELNWTWEFINDRNIFYDGRQFKHVPIFRYFPGRVIIIGAILVFFYLLAIYPLLEDMAKKGFILVLILTLLFLLILLFIFLKSITNFIARHIIWPKIIIDTSGKDLFKNTKLKFDYDGEEFEMLVDKLLENGFDLEYYDDSYCPNSYRGAYGDSVSLSNTFIGSLIRLDNTAYVTILLNKGVKVDERENWIKECLEKAHFDMVELLLRYKVSSNLIGRSLLFKFNPEYGKVGLHRLEAIAELMRINGDYEGESVLRRKIEELRKELAV
ncbi:MAG: hypothetical protein LBU89_00810 [Fibromonadaceae bacterium]|jgi:hypothetical protein|nr:hypothetical protein [Fibromonadaceae bacterium]